MHAYRPYVQYVLYINQLVDFLGTHKSLECCWGRIGGVGVKPVFSELIKI
jgi:hypothetical protein